MRKLNNYMKLQTCRAKCKLKNLFHRDQDNTNMQDKETLQQLLTKLNRRYDIADIDIIHQNVQILKCNNLGLLINRLFKESKPNGLLSTLFEVYFTANLIKNINDRMFHMEYEPQEYLKRPDLKIVTDDTIYYIQIKSANSLERDNRLMKLIKKIKSKTDLIKINKIYSLSFSETIRDDNLEELINFIHEKATLRLHNKQYTYNYPNSDDFVIVTFRASIDPKLNTLTMDISSDVDCINETDKAKNQLRNSLIKAAKGFERNINDKLINIIAIELPSDFDDIDMTEAMYGTEFDLFEGWTRAEDGFFNIPEMNNKITAIIVLQRKYRKLGSDYWKVLCINEIDIDIQNQVSKIMNIIQCDSVWPYNKAPSNNGTGFFDHDTSGIKIRLF